jgi:predicted nucleic acid-binding protein
MYLIDTVILSELRKRDRNAGVVAWIKAQRTSDLFLSVITVGEIERGIERQRANDPAFAIALAAWLDRLLILYANHIVGIDLETARRWGRLSADLGNVGADLMIAATALERGLTVVTLSLIHI